MTSDMLAKIQKSIKAAMKGSFYKQRFKGLNAKDIQSREDFEKLPLSDKEDLRDAYPLGLLAVDDEKIVRIHSSSGTTGTPVIIPYTQKDVHDWAVMFKRCYETAGITPKDRIHITPGYGLWTAGIGFQLGAELLGAMAIPMGPGNTDKQIKMMEDLRSTVICATSSYALLLAEEIEKRGIKDKICLKKGVIGSERWGDKMRKRIANELGVELYDIYGLTEIYGPGIGINCSHQSGMHMWTDFFYYEIINPHTGAQAEPGEIGEIVITTLCKEGAPLIRYRTHDLTREISGDCPCGSPFPRIDAILGRSDDMVKVKGTIIFPGKVDELLSSISDVSSEYQIQIDHLNGRDILNLFFETKLSGKQERKNLEKIVEEAFKEKIGLTPKPMAVGMGELPRSEKKSTRIFDNRY
ncbi:phenylacetate--CoA ligase family protein [Leadbettera azotonutricia]|uniref:Phenylacetate-coenzyme A ligase n=1 Tax=Leadbettera azotonutricia (strain ATCC BAA-888 / DSM 13862 / ZAS-9) TaxID=545695 RepID=F5YFY0_LEAAZ|nr:phenylacetate--CoA ligase [Leadbettera azotonutricia]AEF80781.1 phenylacetate-coenzyme A ligase (Phenylacetyl-CoAligase) (PA-CoA ligase) [Leadbettera azotonutricia ZAS-9]